MKRVQKKMSWIMSLIMMLFTAIVFISFIICASASDANAEMPTGRKFTAEDEFTVTVPFDVQPMTFEALVSPNESRTLSGTIFGNYRYSSSSYVNFDIYGSKPRLLLKETVVNSDGTKTVNIAEYTFDYDVSALETVHLVITHEITNGSAEFTCYVNGNLVSTANSKFTVDGETVDTLSSSFLFDTSDLQKYYDFRLGGDWRPDNTAYFTGEIKNVALYNKALTATEIADSYTTGVNISSDSLIAYYDLTKDGNKTGTKITDSSASGKHFLEPQFQQSTVNPDDYAYAMIAVPDTQILIERDTYKDTEYTKKLYEWIVANEDSHKIKFVMGLGDITQKNGVDQTPNDGIDQTDLEWKKAVEAITQLNTASIPYSLIWGRTHDSAAQLDKYLGEHVKKNFEGENIGYYENESISNYYAKFTAGNNKYMVVALQHGPDDNVLKWANGIISQNEDYTVIITTHAYMAPDGTTLDENDGYPPRVVGATGDYAKCNNGDDMWNELVSKHENIAFVLCGHRDSQTVLYRKDYGDNGNTVYQMLADFQGMDPIYGYETGMVVVLYFSEDGKAVKVEYVSTYKSLEASSEATVKSGENQYIDVVYKPYYNSYELTLPDTREAGEETDYGIISPAYPDKELYPVALFRKYDKAFLGCYYDMNHAFASIMSVYNDPNDSYVIYLRSDVTDSRTAVDLGTFNGQITVDLNGKTISNARNYLLNVTFNDDVARSPSFAFKNGAIIESGTSVGLMYLNYGSSFTQDSTCSFSFDAVAFTAYDNEKDKAVVFVAYESNYESATGVIRATSVFEGCDFNLSESQTAVMLPLRHTTNSTRDRIIHNVTVNGGTVIANAASDFTSRFVMLNNDTNGRADSIKYGKDSDGRYIALSLPVDEEAPGTDTYELANGEVSAFTKISETAEKVTYSLGAGNTQSEWKYGEIPAEYASITDYPIVIFEKTDSGYTFVDGYLTFNAAVAPIIDWDVNSYYVILLRTDAEVTARTSMNNARGTYVVDLNGYTLTDTAGEGIYNVNHSKTDTDPTVLQEWFKAEFKNGTLISEGKKTMFVANYGSGSTNPNSRSYSLSYTFDNVTFKTTQSSLFANYESGASNLTESEAAMRIEITVAFNDCTFDYTDANSTFAMIDMIEDGKNAEYNRTIYDVTVNGGTIIACDSFTQARFMVADASSETTVGDLTINWGDTVKFGKGSDGLYTKLVLNLGATAPSSSEVYVNEKGVNYVFVKIDETDTEVIYRLRPLATVGIDFTPKTSITLGSELVYNVYVPVVDYLKSYTVDDTTYTNTEIVTLDDGNQYYHISVPMAASAAARSIVLKATVTIDGKDYNGTWTISIPKYSKKVLSSDASDVEKTLVKDVLAYIKAAYIYFDAEDKTEVVNAIDEILGDYNNDFAKVEGNTDADDGLWGVVIVLEEKPAICFVLPEGVTADKYTFKSGNRTLEYTVGTKTIGENTHYYAEVSLYAYQMINEITYTDGTNSGTWHINSYYDFVNTDNELKNDANLIGLVEKLYNYAKSAEAYRVSVTNN